MTALRRRGRAALLIAALGLLALPAASAGAEPSPQLAIRDLHASGGEGWHAENRFNLYWTDDSDKVGDAKTVRWSISPLDGRELASGSEPLIGHSLTLTIPPRNGVIVPGRYEARLQLASAGEQGAWAGIELRFDDARPAPPAADGPPGWISNSNPIAFRFGPGAPQPSSGLAGYAVSVDTNSAGSPCTGPCSEADVDFAGPAAFSPGPLADGTAWFHAVAVSGSGVASAPTSVPVRIDSTPPLLRLDGLPGGWVNHPVAVSAAASDPLSGMGGETPYTAIAVDDAAPVLAAGGDAALTVGGEGVHLLSAFGRDAAGNAGASPFSLAAGVVRIDETPPRASFAAGQDPAEPERLEVAVGDGRSGPSREQGTIGVRPAGSGGAFQPLPTSIDYVGLSALWPSDDYPPGSYEFRAVAYDAAGNATATTRRSDGREMVLRNPLKLPTTIESGFGGRLLVLPHCRRGHGRRRCRQQSIAPYDRRPAHRTVPYGRGLRYGARLLDANGAPLAGREVEVVESFGAGAGPRERRTTVSTGAGGEFGLRLAPGPSRQVQALFAGSRTLTRGAGRSVAMTVRAGVVLHASAATVRIGGAPVVFSGRLLHTGATIPRTGRPLVLQFRYPGAPWSEFRTVQSNRLGRFRLSYSFADDDSRGVRFQFRAISPRQSGWPYAPGTSRPVAVTGR